MKTIISLLLILSGILSAMGEEITLVYNEDTDSIYRMTFRTLTDAPGEVEVTKFDFNNGQLFEAAYNIVDEVRIPATVDIEGKTYTVTQIASDFYDGQGGSPQGDGSLKWYRGKKKIIIPQTLTKILGSLNDPSLESVIIENAPIEEISDFVFDNCEKLAILDFGNACKFKELGACSFRGCKSLTNIIIPESVEILGSDVFSGCASLKSIVIPRGVTNIDRTFTDCTSLESVEFKGDMLESISRAFTNCTSLKSISLPAVDRIGGDTFKNCTSLESVTIAARDNDGAPYMYIDRNAFDNCSRLQTFNYSPLSLYLIDEGAFNNCISLREFSLGPRATIEPKAFAGCTGLEKFNVVEGEYLYYHLLSRDGVLLSYPGEYGNDETTSLIAYPAGKTDTQYTVPDDVVDIAGGAFEGAVHIESITIGENVKDLGVMAFRNCPKLKEVTLPQSIGHMPSGTFMECGSLTSVNIPGSFQYIGIGAFQDCTSLTEVTLPQDLKTLGESAFNNCASLQRIDIPENVAELRPNTFRGCSSLTEIKLPAELDRISRGALQDCSSLGSIELPENMTGIDERAFKGCSSLASIEIPDKVSAIGDNAFEECTSLKSAVTGNGVKEIGSWAFYGCTSLEKLILGSSLESIGTEAFDGDINLRDITCLSVTPPSFPSGFPQEVVDNAEVKVPEGSEDLYNDDRTWAPMVEREDTGLDDLHEDKTSEITIDGNILTASGPVEIYTLLGRFVGKIEGSVTLPDDIYVVRTQRGATKIMIRK